MILVLNKTILSRLLEFDNQSNMTNHVNRKVNRHIPDNINVIFSNLV